MGHSNVTECRDRTPLPAVVVLTRNGAIPPFGNRAARSLVTPLARIAANIAKLPVQREVVRCRAASKLT